jgi:hypothetical protein
MALGKIVTETAPAIIEVPVFTELETYNLADIWGQKGWAIHPNFPNPSGRHTIVGGSQVEGVQSISLKARAGAVQSTFSYRNLTTPVIWPYNRLEVNWKLKILSTLTVAISNNFEGLFPSLPANPSGDLTSVMWFGVNNGTIGKVEMWCGSHFTSLWENSTYADDIAHAYKWVVISQGEGEPALTEFYVDGVLVASRVGGGGSFGSPSSGDIPNSFSLAMLASSMNNDLTNEDKMFYDSIQIKTIR